MNHNNLFRTHVHKAALNMGGGVFPTKEFLQKMYSLKRQKYLWKLSFLIEFIDFFFKLLIMRCFVDIFEKHTLY